MVSTIIATLGQAAPSEGSSSKSRDASVGLIGGVGGGTSPKNWTHRGMRLRSYWSKTPRRMDASHKKHAPWGVTWRISSAVTDLRSVTAPAPKAVSRKAFEAYAPFIEGARSSRALHGRWFGVSWGI